MNPLLPTVILMLVIFALTMLVALYSTFAERKVAAFLQDRLGPNRAGPGGILQPLADGIKMIMKEELIPVMSNRFLFVLGPGIAMICALMAGVVIPWGPDVQIGGQTYYLQLADPDFGILYVFAVVSIGVYGIMIGGWASNNKFSLMGALRASSQVISYELSMGLAIIALVMMTGSLSMRDIVMQQQGFNWNIWYQPLGFLIFLVTAFAETNRTPFDLPECETELIGGFHTEYSSMKLGFYLFAEYINMFISSAVMAALYFGGYNYPGMESVNAAVGPVWGALIGFAVYFLKIVLFIFFFMWVRWTVPRFRYDQLMKLGWKGLLPLSLLNIFLTAALLLWLRK
ncbi:MAG: NADH-quinone oxidoreductase subunit NuoH [Chitinophagales bacterium]|nr:NADH-quinone oxidoreductase subunit NuoH [Chitinophagales bacterium]MDW8393384.1 NADH-quinone oxidoreductase subunit NuoH [Chitinophagales bacterium]